MVGTQTMDDCGTKKNNSVKRVWKMAEGGRGEGGGGRG